MADQEKQLKKDISNLVINIADKNEHREYEPLPEMIYLRAKLVGITEKVTQAGTRARFEYDLEGKYEGRKAWCSVPLHKTISEDTGLYKWIKQHLGDEELEIGQFKLSDIVGQNYDIVLENSVSKKDPKKVFQNVVKVRPAEETEEIKEEVVAESKKKKTSTRKSKIKKPKPKEVDEVDDPFEESETNESTTEKGIDEDNIDLPF